MAIRKIRSKYPAERVFVNYDDVVEAFPPDGSDGPLNIGPLPWRSRSAKYFFDAHFPQLPLHKLTKDCITVAQEVPRSGVVREGVDNLLADPLGTWVRGYVKVEHLPSVVSQNEKDVENAESNCRHGKEID